MVKREIQLVRDKGNLLAVLNTPDMMNNLRLVASKYLTPEKICKMALLALSRTPKLAKCTMESVLQCIMNSAEAGLDFASKEGYAYAIPYKNGRLSEMAGHEVFEAQFVPGYKGYIEAAYRSQQIVFIDTQKVYKGDEFSYSLGSEPFIKHIPKLTKEAKELIATYAVVWLKDARLPIIEVMDIESINSIRKRSKAAKSGPWVTDFDEMARKCPVRRVGNRIPKTPEMKLIAETDEEYEFPIQDASSAAQVGVEGLKGRLNQNGAGAKPVDSAVVEEPEQAAKAKAKAAANIEAKKKAALKKLADAEEAKAKKKGITEEEATQTAEEKLSSYKYKCNYCKHHFNEPVNGQLCPNCLTKDISPTEPAEQKA